jgi:hypothetical protein
MLDFKPKPNVHLIELPAFCVNDLMIAGERSSNRMLL